MGIAISLNSEFCTEELRRKGVKPFEFFNAKRFYGHSKGIPCMLLDGDMIFIGGQKPHIKNFEKGLESRVYFSYKPTRRRLKKWLKQANGPKIRVEKPVRFYSNEEMEELNDPSFQEEQEEREKRRSETLQELMDLIADPDWIKTVTSVLFGFGEYGSGNAYTSLTIFYKNGAWSVDADIYLDLADDFYNAGIPAKDIRFCETSRAGGWQDWTTYETKLGR